MFWLRLQFSDLNTWHFQLHSPPAWAHAVSQLQACHAAQAQSPGYLSSPLSRPLPLGSPLPLVCQCVLCLCMSVCTGLSGANLDTAQTAQCKVFIILLICRLISFALNKNHPSFCQFPDVMIIMAILFTIDDLQLTWLLLISSIRRLP